MSIEDNKATKSNAGADRTKGAAMSSPDASISRVTRSKEEARTSYNALIPICVQTCNIETRVARLNVASLNANWYDTVTRPLPGVDVRKEHRER